MTILVGNTLHLFSDAGVAGSCACQDVAQHLPVISSSQHAGSSRGVSSCAMAVLGHLRFSCMLHWDHLLCRLTMHV